MTTIKYWTCVFAAGLLGAAYTALLVWMVFVFVGGMLGC